MSLNAQVLEETFQRAKTENGGATPFGLRFYERLFEKYPAVRPLFNTPPEEQQKKLMASIAAIVAGVRDTDRLIPYLQAMGIRHIQYGTESAHYQAVGENLVSVFEEHLSKEGQWTAEMKQAWEDALKVVSDVMIEAAENPEKYESVLSDAGYQPDGFKAKSSEPWVMSPSV